MSRISLTPRREPFYFLRNDPESLALSLAQAEQLARLPDDVKQHLFSHYTEPLNHLLPEHRALVMRSIGRIETASDIVTSKMSPRVEPPVLEGDAYQPLSREDTAVVLMETLYAVQADGDKLRDKLRIALGTQDAQEVKSLLSTNIYCTWYLSHVLAPFVEEYALILQGMGIDPELVLAEARSHKARGVESSPSPSPASLPVGAPVQGAVPAPTAAAAPASVSPPPLPGASATPRRARTPYVRSGSTMMNADQLSALMAATGRDISHISPTSKLCNAYGSLLPIIDAIEATIRTDEGDAVFEHPPGHPLNAMVNRAASHPLSAPLAAGGQNRLSIAAILITRTDHHLAPSLVIRLAQDAKIAIAAHPRQEATAQPAAPQPAPVPVTPVRPAAPVDPYLAGQPAGFADRSVNGPSGAGAPSAPSRSQAGPDRSAPLAAPPRAPLATAAEGQYPLNAPGLLAMALGWMRRRKPRQPRQPKIKRGRRTTYKAPEATRPRGTPGGVVKKIIFVLVAVIVLGSTGGWIYRAWGVKLAAAWAVLMDTRSVARLVTPIDNGQAVLAFSSAADARGDNRVAGHVQMLAKGGQYYVVRDSGDVLEISDKPPSNRSASVWVQSRFVH